MIRIWRQHVGYTTVVVTCVSVCVCVRVYVCVCVSVFVGFAYSVVISVCESHLNKDKVSEGGVNKQRRSCVHQITQYY